MIEKPVKHGDSLDLPDMGIDGTLIDINTFSVRVRQFDGTIIRIPNEKFFTANIRSLVTTPVRRSEKTVGIAYKEDIDGAISVLDKAIRKSMPFVLLTPNLNSELKN